MTQPPSAFRGRKAILWLLATLLMLGSVIYQRMTGPTHPFRGAFSLGGEKLGYRLSRSGDSSRDERIALPDPGRGITGTLHYRRFRSQDPFAAQPLVAEGRDGKPELAARLPRQPAAGKLEYFLHLQGDGGTQRIPASGPAIVIRFKNPVSTPLLVTHVLLMFLGVLLGLRAGLAALVQTDDMEALAWATLAALTIGGLVLGPLVQKAAFGAYWTGFPFGGDLTDNKTLIMWTCWFLAGWVLKAERRTLTRRLAVGLSAAGMLAIYLIPHSARGSELDYSKLDQGVNPQQAIGTGR
jgi:hypothetical protein